MKTKKNKKSISLSNYLEKKMIEINEKYIDVDPKQITDLALKGNDPINIELKLGGVQAINLNIENLVDKEKTLLLRKEVKNNPFLLIVKTQNFIETIKNVIINNDQGKKWITSMIGEGNEIVAPSFDAEIIGAEYFVIDSHIELKLLRLAEDSEGKKIVYLTFGDKIKTYVKNYNNMLKNLGTKKEEE